MNALSSHVLVAVGMGPGTSAEVSLALKAGKHCVLLAVRVLAFWKQGRHAWALAGLAWTVGLEWDREEFGPLRQRGGSVEFDLTRAAGIMLTMMICFAACRRLMRPGNSSQAWPLPMCTLPRMWQVPWYTLLRCCLQPDAGHCS